MRALAEAILEAGTTPCERYACLTRFRCSEQLLACDSFKWYVKTGKAFSPYLRIERGGKVQTLDVIDATAEKYKEMCEDET